MSSANKKFDVIVLGLGAMGSAALFELAKRVAAKADANESVNILGIDQYSPPHKIGSSHGDTRITRKAIGEGDEYVALALRSYEIWREIEEEEEIEGKTQAKLLTQNGGLIISSGAKTAKNHVENFFENTVAAARKHKIQHEILDAPEIRKRFPQFKVEDNESAYFEPESGFLRPEECVRAELKLALKHGAEIHTEERVIEYKVVGKEVVMKTTKGEYVTRKLIITAGPWFPELIEEEYAKYFKVMRQVLFWFGIESLFESFTPDKFPVFIWELQNNKQGIYGFPALDGPKGGFKIATEQYETTTSPNTVDRNVTEKEVAEMYKNFVAPYFPAASSKCIRAVSCLYPGFRFCYRFSPKTRASYYRLTMFGPRFQALSGDR